MAEQLVLANLSVDASGVVSGVRQSNEAMDSGNKSLGRFGDVANMVAGRLFNFRTALIGVTRVLGVAGIITGLAFALKGLITDLVSSTTWFQNAKEAVTDWWQEVIKGEDALGRLARKMKEIGTTVVTPAEALQGIRALLEERSAKLDLAAAESRSTKELIDIRNQYSRAIDDAINKWTQLGILTEKTIAEETGALRSGLPAPRLVGEADPFAQRTLVTAEHIETEQARIAAALKKTHAAQLEAAAGWKAVMDASAGATQGQTAWNIQVQEFNEFWGAGGPNMETLVAFDAGIALTTKDTQALSEAMNQAWGPDTASAHLDSMARLTQGLREISSATDEASLNFQAADVASQNFAGSLSQAATSGSFSFRQLIGDMLASLGTWFLSMAAAATVRALFGDESQWSTAAYAAAAAVVAFAAARALGSGQNYGQSQSSAGRPGRRRDETGPTTGELGRASDRPSVTVNVQGSWIGTDPNDFARNLQKWLNTASADGVS